MFLFTVNSEKIETLKEKRAVGKIARILLRHKSPDIKRQAISALMSFRGDVAIEATIIEALIQGLSDEDITYTVMHALMDIQAMESVIQALKRTEYYVRKAATEVLGEAGDIRAVEPLIQTLNDTEGWVRGTAAEALGKIGDTRAVEPLIQALSDTNVSVRKEAVGALGEIGDTRAVEPLIQALSDTNENVRYMVSNILIRRGGKRLTQFLTQMLENTDQEADLWELVSSAFEKMGWVLDKSKMLGNVDRYNLTYYQETGLREFVNRVLKGKDWVIDRSNKIIRKSVIIANMRNQAHEQAIHWWNSGASANSRMRGYAICDECNRDIPVGEGFLYRGSRLICNECFNSDLALRLCGL